MRSPQPPGLGQNLSSKPAAANPLHLQLYVFRPSTPSPPPGSLSARPTGAALPSSPRCPPWTTQVDVPFLSGLCSNAHAQSGSLHPL